MQRSYALRNLVPGNVSLSYVQASDGSTYAEDRSQIGITYTTDRTLIFRKAYLCGGWCGCNRSGGLSPAGVAGAAGPRATPGTSGRGRAPSNHPT